MDKKKAQSNTHRGIGMTPRKLFAAAIVAGIVAIICDAYAVGVYLIIYGAGGIYELSRPL